MTATATVEAPQAPEVAALTDETRRELVALREGGMTLQELKQRFPQLTSEQIREVLPPENARERKAREVKAPKTEVTKGVGGRSAKAKSEPKQPKATDPKPAAEPRYVEDPGDLPERAVAARQVMGRNTLAEALGITGSACWRAEQGRIHPAEVEPLKTGLAAVEKRIADGEFVKQERQPKATQPSKAELAHRVEEAVKYLRGGTSGSGKSVAQAVLAILDPPARS